MFGSWHLILLSMKCGVKMRIFARKICVLWILLVFICFNVNVISFSVDVDNRMHLRQLRKCIICNAHSTHTHNSLKTYCAHAHQFISNETQIWRYTIILLQIMETCPVQQQVQTLVLRKI